MDLDLTEQKTFSQMTPRQRDQVLVELGKNLAYTALVSRTLSTSHYPKMEALYKRIEDDHESLSADLESSAQLVYEAVALIAEFEHEMGRGETKH